MNHETDDPIAVAEEVIDRVSVAWESDGAVPGDAVTEEVLWINYAGQLFSGRNEVVDGTRRVTAAHNPTITNRELVSAKLLRPGVIVAQVLSRVQGASLVAPAVNRRTYVIVWDEDAWRIAVNQSTTVQRPE